MSLEVDRTLYASRTNILQLRTLDEILVEKASSGSTFFYWFFFDKNWKLRFLSSIGNVSPFFADHQNHVNSLQIAKQKKTILLLHNIFVFYFLYFNFN